MMTTQTSVAEWVSVKDVARILGVHRETARARLAELEADGLIGHIGNGRGQRWNLERLRAALKHHESV